MGSIAIHEEQPESQPPTDTERTSEALTTPSDDKATAAVARYIHFGPIQFDTMARRLIRDSKCLRLNASTSKLLTLLIERSCKIVTYEEILSRLWRNKPLVKGVAAVDRTARDLQSALDDTSPPGRYMEEIRDQGYVFVAEFEATDNPRQAPPPAKSTDSARTRSASPHPVSMGTVTISSVPHSPPPSNRNNASFILAVAQLLMAGMVLGAAISLVWKYGVNPQNIFWAILFVLIVPGISALLVYLAARRVVYPAASP
jgi:DNA-binding winged helix-turn-helix (wHTH) protein